MKVFAEANILFSPANPESATRILLDALIKHDIVVINEHVWEEARRNVHLKRPGLSSGPEKLKPGFQFCARLAAVRGTLLPDKDQPVLAGAVGARCSHLWTGDRRHFGHLYGKTIAGVLIVSAVMLADELDRKVWLP